MSKFQSFQDHIRAINRWNLNGRNVDRYFLNGLSQQDWEEQVKYVQSRLTDQLISDAMKKMPPGIYRLCGPQLTQKLIGRRNILMQQALKYYRFISQIVEIPESNKEEQFDLTYAGDGKITVQINKIKKSGKLDQVLFNRTFDPGVTNEIRLYGLGGEDKFVVHGNNHSSITVRMVGGDDEDTFAFDKEVDSNNNRFIYDRIDQKNNLPLKSQAHLRLSADTGVNKFDKKDFKYNFLQPLILGSYNSDYCLQLITDFIYQKQGFRKDPYAFRQSLLINYGFGANSLLLNYMGEFKQVFGKSDLVVNVLSKGPNYQSYFFGLGNNTQYINEGDYERKYYRNVYNFLNADVRIRHVYDKWTVSGGIAAQYYNGDEESNHNRFLNDYDALNHDQKVFATRANAGLIGGLVLDTRSKGIIPHNGVLWNTTI